MCLSHAEDRAQWSGLNVGLFMTSVLCFVFLSFPMTSSHLPKDGHVAEGIWLFIPPLIHRNWDIFA